MLAPSGCRKTQERKGYALKNSGVSTGRTRIGAVCCLCAVEIVELWLTQQHFLPQASQMSAVRQEGLQLCCATQM